MPLNQSKKNTILPLYIPVILAYACSSSPVLSYLIAWGGSFFIFHWTWFSPSAYWMRDKPMHSQIMRPIFLTQLIFAGFMCCTSIFYFIDHLGFQYFSEINPGAIFHENHQTELIAQCQRLSLVAHAALVTGLLLCMKQKPAIDYQSRTTNIDKFITTFTIAVYAMGLFLQTIPELLQFSIGLINMAITCGALMLVKGVVNKNAKLLAFGAFIFITNFFASTLSGYKEPVINNVLILGCLFMPYYKKTIAVLALPVVYILFYILPTYATVIRNQSWSGEKTAEEARSEALETITSNENEDEIDETNWDFLTGRLSEISMFTQFADNTPAHREYYGWEIVSQSFDALIPRAFWKEKPNTEQVSMERVYEAGVANRLSSVSAKTRTVVDGYLSYGIIGVFITMLLYGLIAQRICNQAEKWLGGYELGCVLVFNSLFQPLWRGNNFEFMLNNIVYNLLLMYMLFWVLKRINILVPVRGYFGNLYAKL